MFNALELHMPLSWEGRTIRIHHADGSYREFSVNGNVKLASWAGDKISVQTTDNHIMLYESDSSYRNL